MTNDYISQQPARVAPGPKPARKLYSMAALIHDKSFAGKFETRTAKYEFVYSPTAASLSEGKLQLSGTLSVKSARGTARVARDVKATLAATQGGIGSVPGAIQARFKNTSSLPITEATDALSYVGVMYLHLSGINSRSLGLTIDLANTQLNVRLYPTSATERNLVVAYSDLVAAMGANNAAALNEQLTRLNQMLS